jgi:hypothetical protein
MSRISNPVLVMSPTSMPAVVVSVHDHHMPVHAEYVSIEAHERRTVLGLDNADDVSAYITDDPSCEPRRDLINGLHSQFGSSDFSGE